LLGWMSLISVSPFNLRTIFNFFSLAKLVNFEVIVIFLKKKEGKTVVFTLFL